MMRRRVSSALQHVIGGAGPDDRGVMLYWGFLIVVAMLAIGLVAFALEWWAAGRRQRQWLERHADGAASPAADSPPGVEEAA